jgi:hypothetical protein
VKYFVSYSSVDELKSQYRVLAFSNHPDKGGSTYVMQEINVEYQSCIERLDPNRKKPKQHTTKSRISYSYTTTMMWDDVEYKTQVVRYWLRGSLNLDDTKVQMFVKKYPKKWYQSKHKVVLKLEAKDKKLLTSVVKYLILTKCLIDN